MVAHGWLPNACPGYNVFWHSLLANKTMFCIDTHVGALKKQGYSIFRLPREDVDPLQLVMRVGQRYERLGGLTSLLTSRTNGVPEIARGARCAAISGTVTRRIDAGLGLHMLDDIVGAMGATSASLDALFRGVNKLAFEFRDVLEDSIDITKLDQFLSSASIIRESRHIVTLLHSDEICIITATVKSNKILVVLADSAKSDLSAKVSASQDTIGPSVTIKVEKGDTVSFTGEKPLVFGCKAIRLFYENGEYTAFRPIEPGTRQFGVETIVGPERERIMPEYQGALLPIEF
jgi:hypothetical protein